MLKKLDTTIVSRFYFGCNRFELVTVATFGLVIVGNRVVNGCSPHTMSSFASLRMTWCG